MSSSFFAPEQPVTDTPSTATPKPNPVLFSVGDVADDVGVSVTTVKRMAGDLRMDLIHTVGGLTLFTGQQVEKLKAERERRAIEAARYAGGRR